MATEVLQNVRYFLTTVLPNTRSCNKWNSDSVDKAFFWAEYCENIYETISSKPQAAEFDRCIRVLNDVPESDCDSEICLRYLKSSTLILLKGFLENKQINEEILRHVLDKAKSKNLEIQKLFNEADEVESLCVSFIHAFQSTDSNLFLNQEIEADLFIEHVQKSISNFTTEEETKLWLSDFLSSVCCDRIKMLTYLHVLMKDYSDKSSDKNQLHEFLLHWFLQRISTCSPSFDISCVNVLFEQPLFVLSRLASSKFLFYQCYVDLLVKSANIMVSHYEEGKCLWDSREITILPCLRFYDIVSHFKSLCDAEDKVSKATKALLKSLFESNVSPIWQDIGCCVNL